MKTYYVRYVGTSNYYKIQAVSERDAKRKLSETYGGSETYLQIVRKPIAHAVEI